MSCPSDPVVMLSVAMLGVAYTNVNDGKLERCSGTGMALTGYTRNGHCVDRVDDAGSHHICIDMKSSTGGNFCSVTGQPNWCDQKMQCDGDGYLCDAKYGKQRILGQRTNGQLASLSATAVRRFEYLGA